MSTRILIATLAFGGLGLSAATLPQQGTEVQMIVTSADHMMHHPAALSPADFNIADADITTFTALEPGRSLELYVLIDDSADYTPAQKLLDLRQFIAAQPAAVAIGVAYIHGGALRLAEKPTTDHELAARALRAPSGGITASPYGALTDLIAAWPANTLRREVILVTNGIYDRTGAASSVNTEAAIGAAERAGVIVYALYNPNIDYVGQDWAKVEAGLVNLASLGFETGGEAYFIGHTPVFSVAPFLADITEHLAHQYLVKFRVAPRPEAGFQSIFIGQAGPEHELMNPEKVWIP